MVNKLERLQLQNSYAYRVVLFGGNKSVNVFPATCTLRSNACTSCTPTCTSTRLLKNKQCNVYMKKY